MWKYVLPHSVIIGDHVLLERLAGQVHGPAVRR